MHYKEFSKAMSVKDAVAKIDSNTSNSFVWYPVMNKLGSLLMLCGNHKSLEAHLIHYKNGKIGTHKNEMVRTVWSLSEDVHPNDGTRMSRDKIIKTVSTKDVNKFELSTKQVKVVEYQDVTTIKFK